MTNQKILWGIVGLFVCSVGLGVVLVYTPALLLPFVTIKPGYFGPIVIGSLCGHVGTLIMISTAQKWIHKRYGPNEVLDLMRKSTLDDLESHK